MPLKFFYPTWKNGERVSGTLDGAGYYKLLRYVLNISERLTKYILFYVRYHCLPAIRNVNNGSLDEQTWQQVFIPDQFKHFFTNQSRMGQAHIVQQRLLPILGQVLGTEPQHWVQNHGVARIGAPILQTLPHWTSACGEL